MARELKKSRAGTKNFSRHFFRIQAPQSERFRLVFFEEAGYGHSPMGPKAQL
ncbi:DUF1661 domain-containing protein [Porphyromonas gulae]|uniref:DUF1661 domain-containing protein n=1 Tax=Porphyromonas gulae TaxID=111105 RepID=UPI0034E9741B